VLEASCLDIRSGDEMVMDLQQPTPSHSYWRRTTATVIEGSLIFYA